MENEYPEINVVLGGAIVVHEMFVNLMTAGFTEAQALTIIIGVLRPANGAA